MRAYTLAGLVKWLNLFLMGFQLALAFLCFMFVDKSPKFIVPMWTCFFMAALCGYTANRFSKIQDVLETPLG